MLSAQTSIFLLSITDRTEDINQYLKNVSIFPIDIKQEQLDVWAENTPFNPAKLDLFGSGKKTMSHVVYKCLEHINNISNTNLVRNADGRLSRIKVNTPVNWVHENKARVPPQKFKIYY